MADKGILLSAPMVRALLDGRKTQTRRLLKPQPRKWKARVIDIKEPDFDEEYQQWGQWETIWNRCSAMWEPEEDIFHPLKLPYAPGDRLYVREAFSYDTLDVDRDGTLPPWYWADGNLADAEQGSGNFTKPKPSIHMPRWASRLTLLVTDVRVQRVAEISEEDAGAEGVYETEFYENAERKVSAGAPWSVERLAFADLWNRLHTKLGETWEANPWVCAITFAVKRGNIDRIGQ